MLSDTKMILEDVDIKCHASCFKVNDVFDRHLSICYPCTDNCIITIYFRFKCNILFRKWDTAWNLPAFICPLVGCLFKSNFFPCIVFMFFYDVCGKYVVPINANKKSNMSQKWEPSRHRLQCTENLSVKNKPMTKTSRVFFIFIVVK